MRSFLPDFAVLSPRTLEEALEALATEPAPVPLAGGTDLMVYLESGAMKPCTFLNLQGVRELRAEVRGGAEVRLSALTTYRDVRRAEALEKTHPMLVTAAKHVASLAVQSRGTWVGNLVNASPAADGVPALMAYDASIELTSSAGPRHVPLDDFYHGYKNLEKRPYELVTAIYVPTPPAGRKEYYRKVGARRYQAIAKVLLCGWLLPDETGVIKDLRIILGAVAPMTLRATKTEAVLRDKRLTAETFDEALRTLQEEISPIDDLRSTAHYRRVVVGNLLREFFERCQATPLHH